MGESKKKEETMRYGFLLTGLTKEEMDIISKSTYNGFAKKSNVKMRILTYTPELAKNDLFMAINVAKAVKDGKKLDPKKDSVLTIIKDHDQYKEDFENCIKDTLSELENNVKKETETKKADTERKEAVTQ